LDSIRRDRKKHSMLISISRHRSRITYLNLEADYRTVCQRIPRLPILLKGIDDDPSLTAEQNYIKKFEDITPLVFGYDVTGIQKLRQ
jgi:hypothetical protein